jgi:predicted ATPase
VLFALDGDGLHETAYSETDHFRITRDFLNAPERYLRHLLGVSDGNDEDA